MELEALHALPVNDDLPPVVDEDPRRLVGDDALRFLVDGYALGITHRGAPLAQELVHARVLEETRIEGGREAIGR